MALPRVHAVASVRPMTGILIAVAALLAVLGLVLARRGRADPKDLLQSALAARETGHAAAPLPAAGSDDLAQQVRVLMSQGRKIHAVKLWREATAVSLADAVRAVERIAADGAPPRQPAQPDPQVQSLLGPELLAGAQHLVRQGRKIQAVKLVRDQTGLTLREAKDVVDSL